MAVIVCRYVNLDMNREVYSIASMVPGFPTRHAAVTPVLNMLLLRTRQSSCKIKLLNLLN